MAAQGRSARKSAWPAAGVDSAPDLPAPYNTRVIESRATPLMIYDGDCRFCRRWVGRWSALTGRAVIYAPFQDVAGQFPEIREDDFRRAVHLIDPNGTVTTGAEAVLRAVATAPGRGAGAWSYTHVPGFARAAEAVYSVAARHRGVLSRVVEMLFGGALTPSSYLLTRWLVGRLVGFVLLIAFASLLVQIDGLVGAEGIMPAARLMEVIAERQVPVHQAPTLAWIDASDATLRWGCIAGLVLSAGIIVRVLPALCLALAWILYLSYVTVCAPFLNFQWDILLLEVTFLCIFLEPWRVRPNLATERPPSIAALWMLRLCLLKLMVASGLVKLLADDPLWNDLTALTCHYWTQPIPNALAWYAHQLPVWVHTTSCAVMFVIELVVPFAMFGPRRVRVLAGLTLIGLQVLIALTGNYTFFNLLTATLCLTLLDDQLLCRVLPRARRRLARRAVRPYSTLGGLVGTLRGLALATLCIAYAALSAGVTWGDWSRMLQRFDPHDAESRFAWLRLPAAVEPAMDWVQEDILPRARPFRTVNPYGLFRTMTRTRPELIIEGSDDGRTWLAYAFKYKPGDVRAMPPFVAPHQPRLDWQMWFEALRAERQRGTRRTRCSPWFARFMHRLRDNAAPVVELLAHNPFPRGGPRYIRARLDEYRFTTRAERAAGGGWWVDEPGDVYYGIMP